MKRKLMAFAAVLMLGVGSVAFSAAASDGSTPNDDCILDCCPPTECVITDMCE